MVTMTNTTGTLPSLCDFFINGEGKGADGTSNNLDNFSEESFSSCKQFSKSTISGITDVNATRQQ